MGYLNKLSNQFSPDNKFFKERFLTKNEANAIAIGEDEKENNTNFKRMVYSILKEIKKLAENKIFEWDICIKNDLIYKKENRVGGYTSFTPISKDKDPRAYEIYSPLLDLCYFYKENTQDLIQYLKSLGYNSYLKVDSSDMRIIHIDWK